MIGRDGTARKGGKSGQRESCGRPSRRDNLLASAIELFASRGVKNTSIRDITGAAGVSEAALYRHWKSKQALAGEVIDLAAAELSGLLRAAVKKGGTPEEQLGLLVDTLFDYHSEHRDKFNLVVHVAHLEPEMVAGKTNKPSNVVLPVLREGIRAKRFKRTEPELALAMIIGTVARTTQLMRIGLVKGAAARVGRQVREMILLALGA